MNKVYNIGTLVHAETIDDISDDDMRLIVLDFYGKYKPKYYKNATPFKNHSNNNLKNIDANDISDITFNTMVEKFGLNESFTKIMNINLYQNIIHFSLDYLSIVKDIHEMGINFEYKINSEYNIGEFIIIMLDNGDKMLSVSEYLYDIGFDLRKVGKHILDNYIHCEYDCYYEFIWDMIDQYNFDKEYIKKFAVQALLMNRTTFLEKIMERNLVSSSECEKIAMKKLFGDSKFEDESKHVKECEKMGFNPKFVWFVEKLEEIWSSNDTPYLEYIDDIFCDDDGKKYDSE